MRYVRLGGEARQSGGAARIGGEPLLELQGVSVEFQTKQKPLRAVDGVDLVVRKGETLGLVGESGCGKSVLSLAIMGLLPPTKARVTGRMAFRCSGGEILDLAALGAESNAFRAIRGREIAMVYQEPMSALNPAYTVGFQIVEAIRIHFALSRQAARRRAVELLELVGIADPQRRIREYPHEMSGGMRQRVVIAMALACEPQLLICDEPTTALDVTVQAQIVALLEHLQHELGMAMIFISHDLALVAGLADSVAVMYCGHIVEMGRVDAVFRGRRHPYTQGLFDSLPAGEKASQNRLTPIPGFVPDLARLPAGCRFRDRCAQAFEPCNREPPWVKAPGGSFVRCWIYKGNRP